MQLLIFKNKQKNIEQFNKSNNIFFYLFKNLNYAKKKLIYFLIHKKNIILKKEIFKWLNLKGLGYKIYNCYSKLLINFNQAHLFCLKKNLDTKIFILKNNILIKNFINKKTLTLINKILNLKKYNYYKGKGFFVNNKKNYILKKNEKSQYS